MTTLASWVKNTHTKKSLNLQIVNIKIELISRNVLPEKINRGRSLLPSVSRSFPGWARKVQPWRRLLPAPKVRNDLLDSHNELIIKCSGIYVSFFFLQNFFWKLLLLFTFTNNKKFGYSINFRFKNFNWLMTFTYRDLYLTKNGRKHIPAH